MYDDAYAIYPGSQMASQHPEWILKDAAGNNLYIPYGCSGGSCPQFAGDISNVEFRRNWIAEASAHIAHGYRGLFVDDVNLEQRTGNGQGQQVAPVDRSTGQPMSAASWRAYMAEFMAEIRAALPNAEIVHNALWFANSDAGTNDPSIRREIESANYVLLERGVNDSGLTGSLTYLWSVFGGAFQANTPFTPPQTAFNQSSFTFTPEGLGAYTVMLTVSDNHGQSATASATIQVASLPPTASIVLSTTTGGRYPCVFFSSSAIAAQAARSTRPLVGLAGVSTRISPTLPFVRAASAVFCISAILMPSGKPKAVTPKAPIWFLSSVSVPP